MKYRQMLVSPDLEVLVPRELYRQLSGKYDRLYTDRAVPASIGARPMVVCHREGGLSKGPFLDQARLAVDVYANTEKQANNLVLDARAVIDAMAGHDPVVSTSTTGPAPVINASKGPHRRFYADVVIRKEQAK